MESISLFGKACILRDCPRFQRAIFSGPAYVGAELINNGVVDEVHLVVDTCGRDVLDAQGCPTELKEYDLYFDCRKRKIVVKHLSLFFCRLIHLTLKVLFHVTLIGPMLCSLKDYQMHKVVAQLRIKKRAKIALSAEEKRTIKAYQGISLMTKRECREQIVRSVCLDSVRTVIYGVALLAIHASAVLVSPAVLIAPSQISTFIYLSRKWAGELESSLIRLDRFKGNSISYESELWQLAPCFAPVAIIRQSAQFDVKEGSFFLAKQLHDPENSVCRTALGLGRFRRKHRSPFNDCGVLLKKDQSYRSAAAF